MAKSRNNLLGVGGQRTKLPRSQGQSTGPNAQDRASAAGQKQELLRKMRERAAQHPADDGQDEAGQDGNSQDGTGQDDNAQDDAGRNDAGQ